MSGSVREALQMSGSGQENLPDVREWSRGPTGCPVVVSRPSRMSGVVRRPSRMCGIGREAHQDARERSGGPHECAGVIGRPSRMCGSGREALQDV